MLQNVEAVHFRVQTKAKQTSSELRPIVHEGSLYAFGAVGS